jgi:hypothetical protein
MARDGANRRRRLFYETGGLAGRPRATADLMAALDHVAFAERIKPKAFLGLPSVVRVMPQVLRPQKTIWQVSSIAQSAKNHTT